MTPTDNARSSRGFTLIELLIVVIVVAILAAVAIPIYLSQRDKAKDAAVKKGARVVQVAIQTWAVDHGGQYPDAALVTPTGEVAQYVDTWPRNPWTGKPMADSTAYSRGDFGYQSWTAGGYASVAAALPSGYETYGLVGWTSNQDAPFVVQPFADDVLYSTDFKDMNGIKVLMGAWTLTADGLVPSTDVYQNRLGVGDLAVGDKAWTDVRLDVAATLTQGSGYGVYYRADGKSNISGYCFQYDPGLGNKFVVRKVVGGNETGPIASVNMPPGFATLGAEHKISISVVGDHHVISVDGQQVLDFKDKTFASGMAGLRSWNYSKVNFRSLKVSKAK